MTTKTVKLNFQGRVQGVGFRWTTLDISRRYKIKGYVKNLPDGSVEVMGQASEGDLMAFLNDIKASALGRYISNYDLSWIEKASPFSTFEIAY